jgi:hypothetical protein
MQSHGKMDFSTAARSPVVRLTRGQRQSMPVSNGHRLKPSKLHTHSFSFFQGHPKIIPPFYYMEKRIFHRRSVTRRPSGPAVNANPCPSVTSIASNRQNYIDTAFLFSRAIRKSFRP